MTKTPEELLAERKKRVMDAANLKVPDRVPMFLPISAFGAKYGGITVKEAFESENVGKWHDINERLLLEFEPDLFFSSPSFDINTNEILGTKNMKWPGHGLPETSNYQFVEGEYMKAEEYDAFLKNPSDFLFRIYLPRIYGSLEGLSYMPPMMSLLSSGGLSSTFANPAVLGALETIIKATKQGSQYFMATFSFIQRMEALGFPNLMTFGLGLPPFDVISDYLRGLRGGYARYVPAPG